VIWFIWFPAGKFFSLTPLEIKLLHLYVMFPSTTQHVFKTAGQSVACLTIIVMNLSPRVYYNVDP